MAVFEGVWYNYATGKLVLTLNPATAGFLSAAIVTWVNIIASTTWPIWRYLLYLARQDLTSTKNVFYHQRQVMLRNSSGAAGTAGQLITMAFQWRSYRVRAVLHNAVYVVICTCIFLLWTLCGLYAPYIYTRTDSDVLLAQSAHCGWTRADAAFAADNLDLFNEMSADIINTMTTSDIYVQQCYKYTSRNTQCISYPRQSLDFQVSDGTCPFGVDGDVCISVNSTAMSLDTGLLDSNQDFGINAKPSDTVQYRRVATCSPLHSRNFVKIVNTTGTPLAAEYPQGEILLQYLFGPVLGNEYTFQYAVMEWTYPIAYDLSTIQHIPGQIKTDFNTWTPNATFYNSTDGDVSLIFVQGNHVEYPSPVYDPVFAAGLQPQDAITVPYNSTLNLTRYTSSYFVVPLGCKEQHQICLGGSDNNCTPLMGIQNLLNETFRLPSIQEAQVTTAGRIGVALSSVSIADVVSARGSSSLLASRTLNGVDQTSLLPSDQWRKEVANWYSIALARMQALVLSYATGPDNPAFYPYVETPNASFQRYGCTTQRVRDAQGSVNYDVDGLVILIAVGAALAILGLTFESLVGILAKRFAQWRARHTQWQSEGLYHLLRIALEAQGVKEWRDLDTDMPKSRQLVEPTTTEHENQATVFLLERVK